MLKLLLVFLFLSSLLSAKSVHFLEKKYYVALDKTITKKGIITFEDTQTSIRYDKEARHITYDGKYLYSYRGEKVKKVTLESKPAIKMFFMLFESVYFNRINTLSSYFTIEKDTHIVSLLPKAHTAKYIQWMRYKKEKGILDFLEIRLTNGDRIHIEEMH